MLYVMHIDLVLAGLVLLVILPYNANFSGLMSVIIVISVFYMTIGAFSYDLISCVDEKAHRRFREENEMM